MATSEEPHDNAALMIQKAWRRYLFRAVFEYYKELITLCNQGDPQMILKTVNPREGELLDAAAGVFLRFRLGGITFPPSIYYKIFTYRPITDLCASSPRIYAKVNNKQLVMHQASSSKEVDQTGWYQRIENNNWRLFSSVLVPKGDSAESDDNKRIDFHHMKLQRQQDAHRWRKKKKIEWLKQMYNRGRLESRLGQVATLVDSSTQEVVDSFRTDQEEIMEWELDELLAWSDTLNFDEYMTQWRNLACSQPSEMSIGIFLKCEVC